MKRLLQFAVLLAFLAQGCTKSLDYKSPAGPDGGEPGDTTSTTSTTLATYAWPSGLDESRRSTVYQVTLTQGDTSVEIPVFQNVCPSYQAGYMNMTTTDQNPLNIFAGRSISWANFSFSAPVTVEVKVIDTGKVPVDAANTHIIPTRYGISAAVRDNVVTFTISQPGQCSVEIGANGYKNGLMIFANPMESNPPTTASDGYAVLDRASAASVANVPSTKTGLYFKAGVHDIGVYTVPANIKNIYLEGGAWVYGALELQGRPDVKIFGRGVLSSDRLNYRQAYCIEGVNGSDRMTIDGITVADKRYFAIRLISVSDTISWVKVIGGWVYNTDGIVAWDGSYIHNCFSWANDDNIKAYRSGVKFEDMVLWQLNNGGAIQMGWQDPYSENIEIRRVDILHGEWNKDDFNRGVLCLVGNRYGYAGSDVYIKNFLVEDLVTETTMPLIWRITPDAAVAGNICTVNGIVMRNWNVKMNTAASGYANHIVGISASQPIQGVEFDNVVMNGVKLTSSNWQTQGKFTDFSNTDTPTFN